MFHTERDWATFFSTFILFSSGLVLIAYSLAILIALVRKAFQSPRAIYVSFVLTAIASIPLVVALVILWPYLADEIDMDPAIVVMPALYGALLTFAWLAPVIQYSLLPQVTPGAAHQTTNHSPSLTGKPWAN